MRHPRQDDAGFTLVELLVVIILMSVVGTIVTKGMTDAFKTERKQTERTEKSVAVRQAFERLTRDVRGANPVKSATASRLQLFIKEPAATRLVTYQAVTAGGVTQLRQTEVKTPLPTGVATTVTRVVLSRISSTPQLFTYLGTGGASLASVGSILTGCTTASDCYDPAAIRGVRIQTSAVLATAADQVELDATVSIRNKEY